MLGDLVAEARFHEGEWWYRLRWPVSPLIKDSMRSHLKIHNRMFSTSYYVRFPTRGRVVLGARASAKKSKNFRAR